MTQQRKGFRVTYEIVTPESAEQGDFDEIGYVLPGNWQIPIELALMDPDPAAHDMSLREAVQLVGRSVEDSGSWFTQCDSDTDYRMGAEERRSLHPPDGITRASYRRLARLLGCRMSQYR